MELAAPLGGVYQAGTLSGNPVAMAAGIAQLTLLKEHPEYYQVLNEKGDWFYGQMEELVRKKHLPCQVSHEGSLGCLYFTREKVMDYQSAKTSDTEAFKAYFNYMLGQGIYLAPSQFEAMFLSLAHTEEMLRNVFQSMLTFFLQKV